MDIDIKELLNSKAGKLLARGIIFIISLIVVLTFGIILYAIIHIDDIVKYLPALISIFVGLPVINVVFVSFNISNIIKKIFLKSNNKNKDDHPYIQKIEGLIEAGKYLLNKMKSNSGKEEDSSKEQLFGIFDLLSKIYLEGRNKLHIHKKISNDNIVLIPYEKKSDNDVDKGDCS